MKGSSVAIEATLAFMSVGLPLAAVIAETEEK
jgi:hypothetical protein